MLLWYDRILFHNLLQNRAKIAVLPLKAGLILQKELLKIMEKGSVENSPLQMTLTVNLCHSRDKDSRNRPEGRSEGYRINTSGSNQPCIRLSF